MYNLHVIQAEFGDSMLLEFGTKTHPKYILIDGGPNGVYDASLQLSITELVKSKVIEAVIVTHVDADHIKGILDLLSDLKDQKDNGAVPYLQLLDLWLNTFNQTIDPTSELTNRLNSLYSNAAANGIQMATTAVAINGIKEGNKVRTLCNILNVPMNTPAPQGILRVGSPNAPLSYANLTFNIIGPTKENLEELQKEWEEWLAKRESEMATGNFTILSMSDKSVPNLSSIAFLIEGDGRTILFTGDGRGDHLLQGLKAKELLNDGQINIDVLKVPHHGSNRNTDRKFFKQVKAGTYVISGNGKYGNPDYDTLIWIVESAKEDDRQIKLIVTNETSSTKKLMEKYPQGDWGYEINYLAQGENYLTI